MVRSRRGGLSYLGTSRKTKEGFENCITESQRVRRIEPAREQRHNSPVNVSEKIKTSMNNRDRDKTDESGIPTEEAQGQILSRSLPELGDPADHNARGRRHTRRRSHLLLVADARIGCRLTREGGSPWFRLCEGETKGGMKRTKKALPGLHYPPGGQANEGGATRAVRKKVRKLLNPRTHK